MGNVRITPVTSTRDRKLFLRLPEQLYASDPNWVCPLRMERRDFFDPAKNPFFEGADVQLFLAWCDNRPVGRITAHIYHAHNHTHNEKTGFFGFFECVEDYAVADALWRVAADWLRDRGMDRMRGPANFSTNHEVAFLIDGFDLPPVIMMSYNPPYYPEFAERFGFQKAKDLYAYFTDNSNPTPERVTRLIDRIRDRTRATIRPINMSQFEAEVDRVKSIYDRAWLPNWGFVPMTDAEFAHSAKDMKMLVDPELVLFAEVDGEPIGFALALPDINEVLARLHGKLFPFGLIKLLWLTKVRRSIKTVRILLMGFLPEYQKRGIDYLLNHELYLRGTARGYSRGELSWVLDDNDMMNRLSESLGHSRYKTYRLYDYPLNA